jgi:hypothetical protein
MEKPVPRVVEAEEFRLVDANGQLKALIGTRQGEPSVTLYDRQGCGRITLQLVNDLPRISCESSSGQPAAGIGVHEDGSAVLTLTQPDGRLGFSVRVQANENAIVQVFDKDGQPRN